MSAELSAELSNNLSERVEYTRKLLSGFQKRLSEISKENQQMAQKLRKGLASGEATRLREYQSIMKGIHQGIKEIRNDVRSIQKETADLIGDYSQNREQAHAEWNKMQDAVSQFRKTGVVTPPKAEVKKAEKKKVRKEIAAQVVKEIPSEVVKEIPVQVKPEPVVPMTLNEKVLEYINKHPKGVRISEMEDPLGETRMKLGYVAKQLLDDGKVLKVENFYYPRPKMGK
jgi:predicted  nucleic acid-binding Zn-ribbon protein